LTPANRSDFPRWPHGVDEFVPEALVIPFDLIVGRMRLNGPGRHHGQEMVQFTGVFEPLRDPTFFAQVKVNAELGTVCRPNNADLDSDVLYVKVVGVPIPDYVHAKK
jgi:hypothetical protein